MQYREFGRTGVKVSEIGFGTWGIGGTAYGVVDRQESLRALARAEELGCNLLDSARIYGDSEVVLGEFLQGRRDRWFVATKFSKQCGDIERTVEEQLKRLRTEWIDLYQLHWAPGASEQQLYETLYRLKKSGKARYVGVSLYSVQDIDYVLSQTDIDGFQVPFSLLDPNPFLARLQRIREKRPAVIVRSCLKSGFLTGKYQRDTKFSDLSDQRHKLTADQVTKFVEGAERFRFLEKEAGGMTAAAIRYPLAFPEVSTVIVGTKTALQAEFNFGQVAAADLSSQSLETIRSLQKKYGTASPLRRVLGAVKRAIGLG